MSSSIKANKEAAIDKAVTSKELQMTYDNEATVRNAYHTARGKRSGPPWMDRKLHRGWRV